MPRIPKYRKHSLRNFAFVEVEGKRIRLPGAYGSPRSRAAYARFVARIEEASPPPLPPVENATVADVIEHGLDEALRRYVTQDGKPSQEYRHCKAAASIVLDACSSIPAAEFGPRWLRAVRQRMVDAGWSRPYTNRQTRCVIRMFRWGVAAEIVPAAVVGALRELEPLRKGQTDAPETTPVEPVPLEIVDATIPWAGSVVGAMIRLQRLTGMRPQNVCGIRPADLVLADGVLLYAPGHHKNTWRGATLIIPLGPQSVSTILPFCERDPDRPCFSPVESEEERRLIQRERRRTRVQPSQQNRRKARPSWRAGEAYTSESYCKAVHRAVARLNAARAKAEIEPIPRWHPHQLRHTVATMVRKQWGLEAAQAYLGHDSLDATQLYAESHLEAAIRIAREIG